MRRLLTGQAETSHKCRTCDHESTTQSDFTTLFLTMPDASQSHRTAKLSELLDDSLRAESLAGDNQYSFGPCGSMLRDAERQLRLLSVPQHLIVTLKRFIHKRGTNKSRKLRTPVDITEQLTIPVGDGHAVFRLYAAVSHSGRTQNSGHYYCLCRHSDVIDSPWLRLNDSKVTRLGVACPVALVGAGVDAVAARGACRRRRGKTQEERSKCSTEQVSADTAYMLFYRRATDDADHTGEALPAAAGMEQEPALSLDDLPAELRRAVQADNDAHRAARQRTSTEE